MPNDTQQLHDEAVAAYQAGRFDDVRLLAAELLQHDPAHVGALHLNGLVALAESDAAEARNWLERAIRIRPEPILFNTLYAIHLKLGDTNAAMQSIRRGLSIKPELAALHYNLALTLHHHDCLDDAAVSYRRTLELEPEHSAAHNNLGRVYGDLGLLADAERHYRHAIGLAPGNLVARNNLSMLLLATGRFDEAWPLFEDRWVSFKRSDGQPARVPVQVPLPRWAGERWHDGGIEPRATRQRLLVLHEQGFGDSLQFVRYLPLLLGLGRFEKVAYVCPLPLRRLYEHSLCARWPGLVMLDAVPADLVEWDCYCPLMSLPMAFGTRVDTIPAAAPYLQAETGRATAWRRRLEALPQSQPSMLRVGVVWAGGHSGIAVDRQRSLSFAQIAPLLAIPHIHWISLQKTDDLAKRPDTNPHLTDWTDQLHDFADTAALISQLDLIISVDTSVAHLAAALGKPVWLLNRFAGCWRWLNARDDSPWYPTLRLFTQPARGDWHSVLARVAAALPDPFAVTEKRL
ncbi:tetratricopeptide repeat protein [Paraburkholderia sp. BCC1886]|uniref:tetratricopeptide repeat protein n=1 Tax=Paraburkholderia sp. BCC1886 TaxID=2562670 RepID=UPI0011821C30|nr:tetratricopeptide repeat protein [Paraburkholderia sp. BCC1886]